VNFRRYFSRYIAKHMDLELDETYWCSNSHMPSRTFSAIIHYLPSGLTRGRFELCSPSWRIYGLAWKRKQP